MVFVTDIYAAGEQPVPGVTGEALAEAIGRQGHRSVEFIADRNELTQRLVQAAAPGDVVIALGAGDINRTLAGVERGIAARASKLGPAGGSA